MAMQVVSAEPRDGFIKARTGGCQYVVRQPIHDLRSHVHGYELLPWNQRNADPDVESDVASRTDDDDASIFDLGELACGSLAFIQCSADTLDKPWVQALPQSPTVLELAADTEPTPSLISACRALKASGFRLALRNFSRKSGFRLHVELVDYIEIDMAELDANERTDLLSSLGGISAKLLAQHVETQDEYKQACKEGFTLFQGYYFCHPEPLANKRIPGNRLVQLEILETLQNEPADLQRLSQLVRCDASLTYYLLRLLNSPICAMRQEVTSIQSALLLLGESAFRRIATLAIASDFSRDRPQEILRMAFVRGRFCELAAPLCELPPTEQYLIGMVSMFPAMLQIGIGDLVRSLPLRDQARDALLGKENAESSLVAWLKCHEKADWAGCNAIVHANGLNQSELMKCYVQAVVWADSALGLTA